MDQGSSDPEADADFDAGRDSSRTSDDSAKINLELKEKREKT